MANGGMSNFMAVLDALSQLPGAQQSANPLTVTRPSIPGNLPIAPGPTPVPFSAPIPARTDFMEPNYEPGAMFNFRAAEQPLDQALIDRYLSLAGPAPVAPEPRKIGTLEKIAAALGGFSAGIRGEGPQYLAALRAERERPQREFQRRQEEFEDRRFRLGLAGTEAAQRTEEKRQQRAQFEADRQFEREVAENARRMKLTDQAAVEQLRGAMRIQRDRANAEARRIEEEKKEKAATLKRVNDRANQIFDDYKVKGQPTIPRSAAQRIADFLETGKPLTAPLEKIYNRVSSATPGGIGNRTTTPKARKMVEDFEALKTAMYKAKAAGDTKAFNSIRTRINTILANLGRMGFEVGYGDDPYVDPQRRSGAPLPNPNAVNAPTPTAQPAPATPAAPAAAQTTQATPGQTAAPNYTAEEREYAQLFNMPLEQARKELAGQK